MSPTSRTPIPKEPPTRQLERLLGANWRHIRESARRAHEKRDELAASLQSEPLCPVDTTVIGFGSLARGEFTAGSDLDWTLLVDGQVNHAHQPVAGKIHKIVQKLEHRKPGPSGLFGGLMFSHDVVHRIGLEKDTNTNTTQRVLLLLESIDLGPNREVRERVLRALFNRYVGEDLRYRSPASPKRVPRFLLNDIVRYWRTMAVDYAGKRQERDKGWALRNIKLRLSRKLLFSAGLWTCLSCELAPSDDLRKAQPIETDGALTTFLLESTSMPPLDMIASALLKYEALDTTDTKDVRNTAETIFGAYDQFLGLLDDQAERENLEALSPDDAPSSTTFDDAKKIAAKFQHGLSRLFYHTDPKLTEATQLYGVF